VPRKLIAFDFDGVIADSMPVALEEYRAIIAAHFPSIPLPNTQEDLALIFPGPLKTSLRRFGLGDDGSKKFFDLHSNAMRSRSHDIRLFGEVAELVAGLATTSFAIVTSAYSSAVREILERNGYGRLAREVFVLGRELSMPKSAKFKLLAEEQGQSLADVVKVGDMVSDILYAREAPVTIWSVGWGYHPIEYLSAFAPDRAIPSQRELRDNIQEVLS
jgi:phosphoglycolate phosphatase-like HAD superfamily hydrolase